MTIELHDSKSRGAIKYDHESQKQFMEQQKRLDRQSVGGRGRRLAGSHDWHC
jgi:hypothetical protein